MFKQQTIKLYTNGGKGMLTSLREHFIMKELRNKITSRDYREVEFSPKLTGVINSKDKQNLIRCLEILREIKIHHFAIAAPYYDAVILVAKDKDGQQIGVPATMKPSFFKKHYRII